MKSTRQKSKWWRLPVVLGVVLLAVGLLYFALAYNKDVKAEEDKPTATEIAEDSAREAAFEQQQQECVPEDPPGCDYDAEFVSVDAGYREAKAQARGMQVIGGLAIALGGIAIVTGVLIRAGGKGPSVSSPGEDPLAAGGFCSRCGNPISAGGRFCSACGSKTQSVEEVY